MSDPTIGKALEYLASLEPGAPGDGDCPAGMRMARGWEAAMFIGVPVIGGRLDKRTLAGLAVPLASDDKLGMLAFEATASALDQYQRECLECEWIKTGRPEGERFTIRWRKVRDSLGEWWVTPSGRIMLNACVYSPPAPQAPPAPAERTMPELDVIYRPLRRGH